MPIQIESRFYGNVLVLQCKGRLVAGEEQKALEAALDSAFREFSRFVLNIKELERLDSTGMGLLVRHASRARNRGGDVRLAEPPPFICSLLVVTKLTTVLRTFPTEEEAILSFGRAQASEAKTTDRRPRVLVIDQSADLCAFVRGVLNEHGFEVKSTNRFHDAKIMLQVDEVEYILLGPESSKLLPNAALESLKGFAPLASALQLETDFKSLDAQNASDSLLRLFRVHRDDG